MDITTITPVMARNRRQALKVIGVQALIGLTVAGFWGLHSVIAALSALAGMLAVAVPGCWFGWRWFAKTHNSPKQLLWTLVWCECCKLVLLALFAFVSLVWLNCKPLPFFMGFLGTYIGLFGAPLIMKNRPRTV